VRDLALLGQVSNVGNLGRIDQDHAVPGFNIDPVLTKERVRWPTVTTALPSVGSSVILGYHSVANAKSELPSLAVILVTAVISLAVLVPLVFAFFLGPKQREKPLAESRSRPCDPAANSC
jgi:hypothetical protein